MADAKPRAGGEAGVEWVGGRWTLRAEMAMATLAVVVVVMSDER